MGVGGIMPDIDSPVSKPAEFVVSISSAVAPVFTLQMIRMNTIEASEIFLIAIVAFLGARVVLRQVIKRFTVHRGIIQSIPAAIIWGCLVFLAFRHSLPLIQNLAAASAVIGFITHLLIDEMFSLVDISGGSLSPKASSGTALKLFGSSLPISIAIYLVVLFLLYLCAVDSGQMKAFPCLKMV